MPGCPVASVLTLGCKLNLAVSGAISRRAARRLSPDAAVAIAGLQGPLGGAP